MMKQRICFPLLLMLFSCGISKSLHHVPQLAGYNHTIPVVKKQSDSVFSSGNNTCLKNKQSLWELYVEGDPLERGLAIGSLSQQLMQKQEFIFFSKIKSWVPSKFKQQELRNFLKVYNRKLYLNVTEEYKTEIYGVSEYGSPDYDKIAPKYLRYLYLHGTHDIGHALQDLALVGCSSFAVWGDKTDDGSLIVGRNFDFYAGDDFAKEKIVTFVRPRDGYPFMMVTWPGMIGAVSGMNKEGLTITINAAKSKIPLIAKTPISIVSREILQYAKNIDEAIAIAKKRKVFVSESIMIGSANDKKAVIIEVSPGGTGVYAADGHQLVCTNHFQSDALKGSRRNKMQIANSDSKYRYDRLTALLDSNKKITPVIAASILRNKEGINDALLGYGNEKALNQLRAHHGIIFKPEQRLVWVSSNPYQLGEFVCYDLNKVFDKSHKTDTVITQAQTELNIPQDPFLGTEAYKNYEQFKKDDARMDTFLTNGTGLTTAFVQKFQSLNPEYWITYYKPGLYFYRNKEYRLAEGNFNKALTKEITTVSERKAIERYLIKIKHKLQ